MKEVKDEIIETEVEESEEIEMLDLGVEYPEDEIVEDYEIVEEETAEAIEEE